MRCREYIALNTYEVLYTLEMVRSKNNSNINLYDTNNNKMQKSNFLMRQKHFGIFLIHSSNNCCSLTKCEH